MPITEQYVDASSTKQTENESHSQSEHGSESTLQIGSDGEGGSESDVDDDEQKGTLISYHTHDTI